MGDRVHLLRFPWPPSILSPNARAHWAKKAKAAKKHKADCQLLAQAHGCRAIEADGLTVEITFHPPDKRRRDADNMLAAMKWGLDGLSAATGVDDSAWHIGFAKGEPVKGGAVLVQVTPFSKGERGL